MLTGEEYGLELAKSAAEGMGRESINKIAEAIGGIFPFWGIKKKAISTYISKIENSDLPPETKMMAIANARKTYKHLKNQMKIAQIAQDVASKGTDFTASSKVDDEWLDRFMDSAKFVSDEQVQLLWGNILAKEFENPASTPPSVVRILSEITPTYARVFQTLCSLAVHIVDVDLTGNHTFQKTEIILPTKYDYLERYNLTFSTLNELQMLGLIQIEMLSGFVLCFDVEQTPKIHLVYGDNTATILKFPNNKLPFGCVLLTDAGRSIARFAETQVVEGHFEAVVKYMTEKGVEFSDKPELRIIHKSTEKI